MLEFHPIFGPGNYVELTFNGKPSDAIRSAMKANGFRWSKDSGKWWRGSVRGAADLIAAIRTMVDRENGIRRPDGKCWECQDDNGFFRRHGAATPVYCDKCHEIDLTERKKQYSPDSTDLAYEDDCARRAGV